MIYMGLRIDHWTSETRTSVPSRYTQENWQNYYNSRGKLDSFPGNP
jgi:hypothetical protein